MASSPRWKVYLGKEYRAACKHVEDAAALVAVIGDGAEIRYEHSLVVWTEGKEGQPASESYDHVASIAHERVAARSAQQEAKRKLGADIAWTYKGQQHRSTIVARCSVCRKFAVVELPAPVRAEQSDTTTHVCLPAAGGCNHGFSDLPEDKPR